MKAKVALAVGLLAAVTVANSFVTHDKIQAPELTQVAAWFNSLGQQTNKAPMLAERASAAELVRAAVVLAASAEVAREATAAGVHELQRQSEKAEKSEKGKNLASYTPRIVPDSQFDVVRF